MTRNTLSVLILALGGYTAPGLAQVDHSHSGHDPAKPAAASSAVLDDATVKKIDKAAGKLTLAHGPLANGMPAMTMVYRVKDKSLLDKVQPGQKVRFGVDPAGDGTTVVRLETAK
jgi:Cu/Ag efflux protein CusF